MLFTKLIVKMSTDSKSECSTSVFYYKDIRKILLTKLNNKHYLHIIFNDNNCYNVPLTAPDIMFEGINIPSHIGTWYMIDHDIIDEKIYLLLEHEEYGDETAHIIIDLDGNLVLEDVYNGFDDLYDILK